MHDERSRYRTGVDRGKKIGSIAFTPGIYSESVVADSSGNIYTGLRAREGELEVIDDALKRIVID